MIDIPETQIITMNDIPEEVRSKGEGRDFANLIEITKEKNLTNLEKEFINKLIERSNADQFGITESLRQILQGQYGGTWYVSVAKVGYFLKKSWLLAYKSYHIEYLGYEWKFDMIRSVGPQW